MGSGFGGLAAAVRLGARGYRVTVLERLAAPGGRAEVHRQDGFTFDAGPTIVTAPHLLDELWALCGRSFAAEVDLRALDPFYRLVFADGGHLDVSGDAARMRAEVARIAPADLAGYDRYLAHADAMFRVGFQQLGTLPFGSPADMARVLPALLKLSGWRSVHGLVSRYVRDERLRIALGFHPLFIGGSPFTATAVLTLISALERRFGVHFPIGGTGRLVTGLVDLVRHQGGTLRCRADVAEITVADGRATGVRLATGEVIPAAVVVSNADASHTYRTLLRATVRRRWTDRRIDRARQSMSLFVWYFGTSRRFNTVPHHTILLGPRYKGLIEDIFAARGLPDDFSLYLHRPTATDPDLAPPGCDAFYVLAPVPNLDAPIDWTTAAEPFRRRIAAALETRLLPGLSASVVTSRVTTPLDFAGRQLAFKGAAFGLEPVLTQCAWFRPHNRSEDVDRLYLVGAGTHPGAGIPGVLSSAKILDQVVPHADALR
ncbi:phytoene desaturase [Mongoliimonas terrestris]|uniref:phytoene desaturase n=1 Tax=Mongoliimonas terrestris TaxID=1709001 RepID=UPI001FD9CC82|nr:phytoene desaturase [Mongoliimonas terrestris]